MKRVKYIERHFFIFLHFFFQNNVHTYHQKSFKLWILWWWNRIQIRKKKREINSYAVQKTLAFLCSADNVICFLYSFNSIFSSPEHEVLMVSYWDSAVSGVRRPACVVRRPSSTFYLVYALEATVLVGYS